MHCQILANIDMINVQWLHTFLAIEIFDKNNAK